jgi:septum formation protein
LAAPLPRLILASRSPARAMLLNKAGISFEAIPAAIDERAIEAPLVRARRTPAEIAVALAEAKAVAVSRSEPAAIVIGSDQTLEAAGQHWSKPESIAEARDHLQRLSGRTHALHAGVAAARNGAAVWRHLDTAHMTMRELSAGFIDAYLTEVGDEALTSVGAYQVERRGIQLFARIEGDFFTILGLPLLPLLAWLRAEGVVQS